MLTWELLPAGSPQGHVGDLSQGESGREKKGAVRAQPEAPTLEAGLKIAVPKGGGDSHTESGRRKTGQGRRDTLVADDFNFGVGGSCGGLGSSG